MNECNEVQIGIKLYPVKEKKNRFLFKKKKNSLIL